MGRCGQCGLLVRTDTHKCFTVEGQKHIYNQGVPYVERKDVGTSGMKILQRVSQVPNLQLMEQTAQRLETERLAKLAARDPLPETIRPGTGVSPHAAAPVPTVVEITEDAVMTPPPTPQRTYDELLDEARLLYPESPVVEHETLAQLWFNQGPQRQKRARPTATSTTPTPTRTGTRTTATDPELIATAYANLQKNPENIANISSSLAKGTRPHRLGNQTTVTFTELPT